MNVSVPKCFYTQYTAGTLPSDKDASPEAPESILVLEDMRPLGYRVNGLVLKLFALYPI